MILTVKRYWLSISPENETDEAYIETVLGLKENGDSIRLVRENVIGLHCIANLRTKENEET